MKRWMNFMILIFVLAIAAACGTPNAEDYQKDKDAAAQVIAQFEVTQSQITYKDPASFTKGDQYLTPEFAKQYHELRAGMEQFIKDSKATVSGTDPTISFIEHDGDHFLFNFEANRTITSEETNSSASSQVKYIVTVTKQDDGSFLISNMEEPEEEAVPEGQ